MLLLSSRTLFARLKPYRSTDRIGPDRGNTNNFFPPLSPLPRPDRMRDWVHRARGMRAKTRGDDIALRRLTGYRFLRERAELANARALQNGRAIRSRRSATLGNPFDRGIDIQADERHVRKAFV